MIHSTAIIDKSAVIGQNVEIGPYVVIGEDVTIGNGTIIGAHATIECARIGQNCKIFSHASIGAAPQDLKYAGEKTVAIIGDGTTIRDRHSSVRQKADDVVQRNGAQGHTDKLD